MVVLWTDALLFLLASVGACSVYYLHAQAHHKRALDYLKNSPIGMASWLLLCCFLLIALIDSLHFHSLASQNKEVISVLDTLLATLRSHTEKTYSAPFASTLFSKEMLVLADGNSAWGYPRLSFGGQHLATPNAQHLTDILIKTGSGLIQAAGLCLFTYVLFAKRIKTAFSSATAQALWLTFFTVFCLAYTLTYLSQFYHVLGTDKVGEDVFYQTIKSIRTGLVLGSLTTLIMLPLAILFGILAGFFQGWIDDVIQYVYTTLNSIPSVLLIAAAILMVHVYMANHEAEFTSLMVRADMRLLFLCLILGVTSWTGLCRLLRAETLKLREMDYVQAAIALGVKQRTILWRHILPNVMHIIIISIVLDFSSLVLAEAVLSYINIGVDPTTYSWGNMINGARLEMAREPVVWWSLTGAFVLMFMLVLAANLFADTLQNAFDPRSNFQRHD